MSSKSTDLVDNLLPSQEHSDQTLKHYIIIFIYSATQEVLEYPLEYTSIFRVQQLCQEYKKHLPGSLTTWLDLYAFLLQIKSVACIFYLYVAHQVDTNICTNHLHLVRSPLDMFKIYLALQYLV